MDAPSRLPAGLIDLATSAPFSRTGLRLEPATRTLQGPATALVIEPRVMQVLLALANAEGLVVSREALLRAGWGEVVVGDDALHRAVAGARRALREGGVPGWTIDTIARVGYRLRQEAGAAEPDADAATLAAPSPSPAASRPTPRPEAAPAAGPAAVPRRRWVLFLGGGATAAALASWGVVSWQAGQRRAQAALLAEQGLQALRLASPRSNQRAVELLARAAGLQPKDAVVWGQLALARRAVADAVAPEALGGALQAVDEAIGRALSLDPRQPDALCARAQLVPAFGQWVRAEAAFREVLQAVPSHLPSLDSLSFMLAGAGVIAEHDPMRLKTIEGDPLHAGYNFRSIFSHWMNGRIGAADQAGERGLELWPGHLPTWLARLGLLAYTGRADRALALLEGAASSLPSPVVARMRRVWPALVSGQPKERAAARAGLLAGLASGGPLLAVTVTLDLAALGEVDTALDVTEAYLLERGALQAGTSWRPGQPLHVDVRRRLTNHLFLPVCAAMRAHPRFGGFMRQAGLEDFWRSTGRTPDHLRTG
jgi:DNA-binding winged helix-turn-helix (wHTH) protein